MPFKIHSLISFWLLLASASRLLGEFDHSHILWDQVLKAHVRDALVDYRALSENSVLLDRYLKQLNSVSRSTVDSWSREHQMAFWINAYNALTVRVILDYYPIKTWTFKGLVAPRNSIIQIPGVWDKLTWTVAGESLTIGHIEHGILRPDFREPRIHFVIVCASIGCPDLRAEAYTYDRLNEQMDEQTRLYVSNQNKGVKLDFEKKEVSVTKLFKWFTEDFVVDAADRVTVRNKSNDGRIALKFISHYLNEGPTRALLQSKDTDFGYLSYDWSLNEIFPEDG